MSLPATTLPTPLQPDTAAALARLADGMDGSALLWASGYLAGMAHALAPAAPIAAPVVAAQPATIVYGSQTGNAKRAAEALLAKLQAANLPVRLLRADAYPLRELADETLLYVVVSTQGDGDPPDDARGFLEFVEGRRAPALKKLKFAVLALGDSSYPQFCAIGRRIDQRLQALGGERIAECADADLDIENRLHAMDRDCRPHRRGRAEAGRAAGHGHTVASARGCGHAVFARQAVRRVGARQPAHHLRCRRQGRAPSRARAGRRRPGLRTRRCAGPVAAQSRATGRCRAAGDGARWRDRGAHRRRGTRSLRAWLLDKRELTRLARPFVAAQAERSGDADLQRLLAPEHAGNFQRLLATLQPIDLLQQQRADWDAESLVAALRPLQPRLYSIASSRKVVGDEAHLTVAHVEYDLDGQTRWGAASHQLATRAEGDALPVYIEANERFRLPADSSRDIIMIGAGTGVAPFRGFVQERAALGGSGRNWLFFGAPHQRSDFLYQLEWQRALKDGQLDRIDLAFSRDSAPKTYVQQRIGEQARTLYDWLQGGAHLYVCGATAMGKDVHAALIDALCVHGGRDAEAASAYVDQLLAERRYARDVY
jgi:sulfite reductase (NADPH) flavoprotein alpha-component